jgi:hypothetical protein
MVHYKFWGRACVYERCGVNGWTTKALVGLAATAILAYIAYIGTALESHASRPAHDAAIAQISRLEAVTHDLTTLKHEIKHMQKVREALSREVSNLKGYLTRGPQ